MSSGQGTSKLASRLDKLYEFEREPVGPDKLHGGRYFAGLFAGEHVAATEFVIGALFVQWGVGAKDLLLGLLVGNLLAVLSWVFICAPIAVHARVTLYWYLRRIAGPGLTVVYNVVNAVLYCILAGAMIAVSASAVSLAFSMKHPGLNDVYPNSVGWVVVVLAVGMVVVTLAIAGFKKLSNFASICAPWMFLVFIAGALATLPKLGDFNSLSELYDVAKTKVWTGKPYENPLRPIAFDLEAAGESDTVPAGLREELAAEPKEEEGNKLEPIEFAEDATLVMEKGDTETRWLITDGEDEYVIKNITTRDGRVQKTELTICAVMNKLGFWHIMFFAWFCNLAMHVGLSDMALFRYARKWTYGFYSAFGMFLGHYLAWVCAGIMGAMVVGLNPGQMAYTAAGFAGAVAVVIAGWTTANPTMYRAGLALQIATPNSPRWKVTLVAGVITSIVACFPVFFMKLLDFVAIYGLTLMPIGAIVFTEHWLFRRIGLRRFWAEKRGVMVNLPALITWVVVVLLGFPFEDFTDGAVRCPMDWIGIHLFFRWLPGWFIAVALYTGICKYRASRLGAAFAPGEVEAEGVMPDPAPSPAPEPKPIVVRSQKYYTSGVAALVGLILCIALPVAVFLGEPPLRADDLVDQALASASEDRSSVVVKVPDLDEPDLKTYGRKYFAGQAAQEDPDTAETSVRVFDYENKSLVFIQQDDAYSQNMDTYKRWFLVATIIYFMGAIVWFSERQKARAAAG